MADYDSDGIYETSADVDAICDDIAGSLDFDDIDVGAARLLEESIHGNVVQALEDYERGVRRPSMTGQMDDDDDESEQPKDGTEEPEEAIAWLQEAGFTEYVNLFKENRITDESMLEQDAEHLTDFQFEAVRKRVQSLNRTIKRKAMNSELDGTAAAAAAGGSQRRVSGDKLVPGNRTSTVKPSPSTTSLGSPSGTCTLIAEDPNAPLPEQLSRRRLSRQPVTTAPTRRVFDLTSDESDEVRRFALAQLTGLMESSVGKMPYKRKKAHQVRNFFQHKIADKQHKKIKDGAVFGVSLEALLEREGNRVRVPPFLNRMLDYLTVSALGIEGIFRKVGSQSRIRELKDKCEEMGGVVDFEALSRPHDVAALLKTWLRELPQALLTEDLSETFCAVHAVAREYQLQAMQLLVILLPAAHTAVLHALLAFLHRVAERADLNKMGVSNLAVVFAPNLFHNKNFKDGDPRERDAQVAMSAAVKVMIDNYDKLWTVPSDVLSQMNNAQESRRARKFSKARKQLKGSIDSENPPLMRSQSSSKDLTSGAGITITLAADAEANAMKTTTWLSESEQKDSSSAPRAIVRVELPSLNTEMTRKAILLGDATTVANVVMNAMKHLGDSFEQVKWCLVEIGSDGADRRLYDDDNMLRIIKHNPNARYIVRERV